MVFTAQTLINLLKLNHLRMADASLIVIDEIHHAVKAHPYVILLSAFYHQAFTGDNKMPHLLGLTASPVAGTIFTMHENLTELCNLTKAAVFTPCIYWDDMMLATNRPKMDFYIAETTDQEVCMTDSIEAYSKRLIAKIRSLLNMGAVIDTKGLMDISILRGVLRTLTENAHSMGNEEAAKKLLHLQQVISAQEINSVLGPKYARDYLKELFEHHELNCNDLDVSELLVSISRLDLFSAKLEMLIGLLIKINVDENTRALVFVKTKRTARLLIKVLTDNALISKKWEPSLFVGQGLGQIDGMSWADQQAPVLKKFCSGVHRLLVSTNVLQEGIDVPVCNYVILFDLSWTLTSFIQTRGRARANESKFILICNAAQKMAYENLIAQESNMKSVILNRIIEDGTMTPKLALLCIDLKLKLEQLSTSWKQTELYVASDQVKGLERNHKSIRLIFYNLEVEGKDLELDADFFSFLSHLPFTNVQWHVEPDSLFGESKKAFIFKAHIVRHVILRISEISRMIINLSKHLQEFNSLLSFSIRHEAAMHSIGEKTMLPGERFQLGAFVTPTLFNAVRTMDVSLRMVLNFNMRAIQLFYGTAAHLVYRVDIGLHLIDKFIIVDILADCNSSLYIPLKGPAFYYYAYTDRDDVEVCVYNMDSLEWYRASICQMKENLDISDLFAIKIDMNLSRIVREQFIDSLRNLDRLGVQTLFGRMETRSEIPGMLTGDDFHLASECVENFEDAFDLQVLRSSCGPSLMYRIHRNFLVQILNYEGVDRQALLLKLSLDLVSDRFFDANSMMSSFDEIIRKAKPFIATAHATKSDNTTLIRYITLTPTRTIYFSPKRIIKNRVLRTFNPAYFLRVNFRDEDMDRITFNRVCSSIKNVLLRISDFLHKGLCIGRRQYEFLAMSSSQLREHGCWFVAAHFLCGPWGDEQILSDAHVIRNWCGNFDSIKNVAKYVARLGQSLSTSQEVATISPDDFEVIPDYKVITLMNNRECKYIFSDGIGMLTYNLAKEIADQMRLAKAPSAFQIRFAGFKGVLSVNPESDCYDRGRYIWFRPSMEKFSSSHCKLEVLNYSKYIPCYLNRQVILLLSSLGVSDEAVISLQDQMLATLPDALINEELASKMLASRPVLCLPVPVIHDVNEPFSRLLLLSIYRFQLTELLTRSRIFVPLGRILMGVIDETGLLKEDEVFVQISKQPSDSEGVEKGFLFPGREDCWVVECKVVIAKNPCMHPGDVRLVSAVRNALLERYHYDCIVFPRHGPRPLTDMCSGSDLDGDLYFVSWDPTLLPPTTHEPMDYEAPAAKETENIGLSDIIEYAVNFIANDQLGTIANSHLAYSDVLPEGVKSSLCIQLAMMFSYAVDFPKTGFVSIFPKEIKVNSWPDFMEKHDQTSHLSDKVIGRMYRKVRSVHLAENVCKRVNVDKELLVDGFEEFMDVARDTYQSYAEELFGNLKLYNVTAETQVFSDSLLNSAKVGNDTRDLLKVRIYICIALSFV